MKDKGLNKGIVQEFETSKKGESKAFFGFRKLFWDYLNKLNIPFLDTCCSDAQKTSNLPVGYNETDGIVTINTVTKEWEPIPFDINSGNFYVGFFARAAANNIPAGAGGAISVSNYFTSINTDAGGDAFTIADGTQPGQLKKIKLVVDGGGNAVVTFATSIFNGGTTATFNDADDYLIMQWTGGNWLILENNGVTIS